MPTDKKRINITVDDKTYSALAKLSKKKKKSVSNVSLSLIERALELSEDMYFSKEADQRLEDQEKRVAHDLAWNF